MNRLLFRNEKGFTLVEIAIVLVIIGLIIGAAAKGKNLMRSAEQKKIYNKFLNEWNTAYLTFYDRTGQILGDFGNDSGGAIPDGQADTGGDTPSDTNRNNLISSTATGYMDLSDVGISAPVSNIPGNTGWGYRVKKSNGSSGTITVAFDYQNGQNVMVVDGIPSGLAISFDTIIDGSANSTAGDFQKSDGAAWATGNDSEAVQAYWAMEF